MVIISCNPLGLSRIKSFFGGSQFMLVYISPRRSDCLIDPMFLSFYKLVELWTESLKSQLTVTAELRALGC